MITTRSGLFRFFVQIAGNRGSLRDSKKTAASKMNPENQPELTIAIRSLSQFIDRGEVDLAESILRTNPQLLRETADVVTPFGVMVRGATPYERALGAGHPKMVKMITPFFDLANH